MLSRNVRGTLLESAKFALYLAIPIGLMQIFVNNPQNLEKFKSTDQYPVRITEAPPSPEELREMARELARKRDRR